MEASVDTGARFKELSEENSRLNELITKCQEKLHTAGLEVN